MKKLSVVVSVFNEERKIEECLKSVKDLASEIIVIDNNSTDNTYEIAKKYTDRIYKQKNDPQKIDLQKNLGIEKATGDWILILDADERIPKNLDLEIKEVIEKEDFEAYEIPRKNIIFGKWIEHSIWWPDYQLRLFKRGKGRYVDKAVHKTLKVDCEVGKMNEAMLHENYESISQYISKMNNIYTENEADQIILDGKKLHKLDALRLPVHDFLKTFFFQKGYKDGLHGLVLSLFQAFYAVIVFAKVWEKQGFKEENSNDFLKEIKEEILKLSKEFQYWFLTESIENSKNIIHKTYLRMLRKNSHKKTS